MPHPFLRKLRHGADLRAADEERLLRLAGPVHSVPAHQDILAEGDKQRFLPLIIEGWACRYRLLANGRRQIISFAVPGDLCEPFGALPRFLDTSFAAITPVVFAAISIQSVAEAAESTEAIKEALWWDLLMSSAIERERIVSLGRRTASERLAHLFCELHFRLEMVGLSQNGEYDLPVTQADLSDIAGLSTVHTNRSLQDLRKTGLISLRKNRLKIHDIGELCDFSQFDPAFLKVRAIPENTPKLEDFP